MQDLLVTLLAWIGLNTGYDVEIALPNVIMTKAQNLCANYGLEGKEECAAANIKAFYNKSYTIYLQSDFDPDDKVDRSRLVHELVHYVQWANKENQRTCLGHLEVEAYELQDRWRAHNRLSANLDPFKMILLSASCEA